MALRLQRNVNDFVRLLRARSLGHRRNEIYFPQTLADRGDNQIYGKTIARVDPVTDESRL